MKVEDLATIVIAACEEEAVEYMMTGAFAVSYYGIPRSTKDVDFVLSLSPSDGVTRVIRRLAPEVSFDSQVQFDTLTWGRRHVGICKGATAFKVELFELFGDPFVQAQFSRKKRMHSAQLGRQTWLPTAEDLLVQKLRWARSKDLDDVRDVLAVQGPETLDMAYVENWCRTHGTLERLQKILAELPPL
jgi:hypothetical protein